MQFKDIENEFNLYMLESGMDNKKTRGNYRSWLKYLETCGFDIQQLSDSKIDNIIEILREQSDSRDRYKREDDLSNFKSALRKLKDFEQSTFEESQYDSKIVTEAEQTILSRRGQAAFKKGVVENCNHQCVVTGCQLSPILIASHIKPWKLSTDAEKIDPNNGLLLVPNFDKLFDKGFISFGLQPPHKLFVSSNTDESTKDILGLKPSVHLNLKLNNEQIEYLKYHKENIFIE